MIARFLPFIFVFGCAYISDDVHNKRLDHDGDGFDFTRDCDDQNPEIGVMEWFIDEDGDGYGHPDYLVMNCDAEKSGYALNSEDCNDENAATYPGAAPLDSTVDCMTDEDGDGYGDSSPAPNVAVGSDCNDLDSSIHPNSDQGDDCNESEETDIVGYVYMLSMGINEGFLSSYIYNQQSVLPRITIRFYTYDSNRYKAVCDVDMFFAEGMPIEPIMGASWGEFGFQFTNDNVEISFDSDCDNINFNEPAAQFMERMSQDQRFLLLLKAPLEEELEYLVQNPEWDPYLPHVYSSTLVAGSSDVSPSFHGFSLAYLVENMTAVLNDNGTAIPMPIDFFSPEMIQSQLVLTLTPITLIEF